MKQISMELTALSPLAVRADHAASGEAATRMIAGTTLVGSLAAVHRLLYPTKTDEFKRLFLAREIFYPFLMPALFQQAEEEGAQGSSAVSPFPRTAQSCKHYPGFVPS